MEERIHRLNRDPRRWTRRKFLVLAGGSALASTACGAAAKPVAKKAAPWVGQFLLDVGANVVGDLIADLFDQSDDEQLELLRPAKEQLIRGGFTDSVGTHFELRSGVSDIYQDRRRTAFGQVDGESPFETCLGICNFEERTWVAVEGPVLGALRRSNMALADAGLDAARIDELTTPLELARPRGEIAGDEMRFDVPFAIRRYRTKSGSLQVSWEAGTLEAGSGSCEVDINDGEAVFEIDKLSSKADEWPA